jgi:archaellum component FlaC
MSRVVAEKNWYVQSSQRNLRDPINNLVFDIPTRLLLVDENQTFKIRLISFNTVNTFYNVWNLPQNIATITYNGVDTPVRLVTGFYTTIASINTAIQNAINASGAFPSPVTITANVDGTTKWKWTGSTINDIIRITFTNTTTTYSLFGFPDNFGNPYDIFESTVGPGFAMEYNTPCPITYNYIQNINLRMNLPSLQNLEYDFNDGNINFSQLFAKIPIEADPFKNIWFLPSDTEYYVAVSLFKGVSILSVNFQITDDLQNPLPMFYDWEAVFKIEIMEDYTLETRNWQVDMRKIMENIFLQNNDIEHILMGEPRAHESDRSNSILSQLEDTMIRLSDAFYHGDSSVFMTTAELTGTNRSIADEVKFLSEHFEATGAVPVNIAALTTATTASGITQGVTNSINAIKDTVRSVEDTVGAVRETVGAVKDTVDAVKQVSDSVKSVADSVNNVVSELKKVDEEIATVENEVQQTLDQMKSDNQIMNGLLNTTSNNLTIMNSTITGTSDILNTISSTFTNTSNTWTAIGLTFTNLYSYLTSHQGKITYDTEISELNRFMSESDPIPEVDRWVATTGASIQFDPQRSDVSSYNELISRAISLQDKIHDRHLETWIEQHPEK